MLLRSILSCRDKRSFRTLIIVAAVLAAQSSNVRADWKDETRSFFASHCFDCHTGSSSEGRLDLSKLPDDLSDITTLNRWVKIHDRVAKGDMPPKDTEVLKTEEKNPFLITLEPVLKQADLPFRKTITRRLTAVEYENTIRDLFGIQIDLKDMLPEDQHTQGFNTVGSGLGISTEQIEIYLQAADAAIDLALGPPKAPRPVKITKLLAQDKFASRGIGKQYKLTDEGNLIAFNRLYSAPVFLDGLTTGEGTYRVRVEVRPYESKLPIVMSVYAGDVIVRMRDIRRVGFFDIPASNDWTVIEFEDYSKPASCYQFTPYSLETPLTGPKQFQGGGLEFRNVTVEGPLEPWPSLSRQRLLGNVDPARSKADDAKTIVANILPRAFRRAVTDDEINFYTKFATDAIGQKRAFLDAIRVSLNAILTSPEFLFLQIPIEATPLAPDEAAQYALASRLSYFLWSSPPDDELLALARQGKLSEPSVLREQTERMMRDPRIKRFVGSFVDQWLALRLIDETVPDARLFPEYDEFLRYSMVEESRHFLREMLDSDRPVQEFIDSDWLMLNERMAKLYGLQGVSGSRFRRVELHKGSIRGGVITQASVLKVTANGTNTSPVIRGRWVVENIMGQHVDPPPPGVSAIEPDIRGSKTVRQQLEKHRNDPNCMACHKTIDPPGFALEAFDPVGNARAWYRVLGGGKKLKDLKSNGLRVAYQQGLNVDDTGHLSDGTEFDGIIQFKKLLLKDPSQITRCLTEKLLIYSLGRELGYSDRQQIEDIVTKSHSHKDGFRSLIHEVVQSEAFKR